MAERKPLFMSAEGWSEEMATADSMTLGGLTMGGDITMGTNKITGLGAGTDPTDAVTKAQLDAASGGLSWKDPVTVIDIISDATQAGSPPTASVAGEAWVVDTWGGGFNDGDIVEWDGSAWNVILSNSGGEPPDGTRVVVAGPPGGVPAGSFTGQAEDIATYSTTGSSWSFVTPSEGDAVLVIGDGSFAENVGYTFNDTNWIQFTGPGTITAGDGLSKDGNTLDVNAGDGIQIASDRVAIELSATPGLQLSGTTPDKTLEVLANTSAGIEVTASGVGVDLAGSNPGLQFDGSGDLQVLPNTSAGIEVGASGIGIDLATDPGLQFNSGLEVLLGSAGGLEKDASGLAVKIDDTPDTLDVDSDGLKVVGLPSQFKINDTAVGADVTAANLDELTDGSVTTLHSHAEAEAAERVENAIAVDEAIAIGDPVYFTGTGDRVGKSLSNNLVKSRVTGVAKTAQSTVGQNATIVSHGEAAGVLLGATPGTPYFLQAAGGIGTSLPPAGNRVVRVGYAVSATDLWVAIMDFGRKAA